MSKKVRIMNLRTIYFSATHTSERVAKAISCAVADEFAVEDITFGE